MTAAKVQGSVGLTCARLDEIYHQCTPGPMPVGDSTGTALILTGTWAACAMAWMVRKFFWQGKLFDRAGGTLVNRITPIGIRAIHSR